jgi:hypothetical protein
MPPLGSIDRRKFLFRENFGTSRAGVSRPEEASANEVTDPRSPIQPVPREGNPQINGSLEKEAHADTATS